MNATSLNTTVALGVLTGMRSMAGAAAFAFARGGVLGRLLPVLAAGELIADKLPQVGDRIDPGPLVGRACMGALVGGAIAREEGGEVVLGGVVGALTAVAAAHLAYRVRRRLFGANPIGGLLEDAVVVAAAAAYVSRVRR